jgi:hypothetical protein
MDGCHHCGSKGPLYDMPDSALAICKPCRLRFGPCDCCGEPGPMRQHKNDVLCSECWEQFYCPRCGREKPTYQELCESCDWHRVAEEGMS